MYEFILTKLFEKSLHLCFKSSSDLIDQRQEESVDVQFVDENIYIKFNKPGPAQVGAISKAQK